jgi:hypothetical protein
MKMNKKIKLKGMKKIKVSEKMKYKKIEGIKVNGGK